ncbi:hypothetical protein [Nocardioides sp. LS1]|uniref:hypothetical protein n=1 Tax=Nocardioides sp. LS1 TaxID=1027620 RepID=UPI0011CEDFFA|nr:hypothetical protein [Nocardioides sp. LS1]
MHSASVGATLQDGRAIECSLLWEDESVVPDEILRAAEERRQKFMNKGSAYDYGFECEECGKRVDGKDRQTLARKKAARTLCAEHIAEALEARKDPIDW